MQLLCLQSHPVPQWQSINLYNNLYGSFPLQASNRFIASSPVAGSGIFELSFVSSLASDSVSNKI